MLISLLRVACIAAVIAAVGSRVSLAADAIHVTGRALDAATGKLIPQVRVCAASARGNPLQGRGEVTWQQHLLKTFEGGKIDFRMQRGYAQTVVRIDADGYRPYVSPVIQKNEPMSQDFMLHRDSLQGVVLTPEGKPAINAQVAISTYTLELAVDNGQIKPGYNWEKFHRKVVHTDVNGRFELPAEIDPLTIVVTHESGFGQQPIRPPAISATPNVKSQPPAPAEPKVDQAVDEKSPAATPKPVTTGILKIKLQKWGSVSGQLITPDGTPVVGRKLWISGGWPGRDDPGLVSHNVTRKTAEDGRFTVDRLAPGTGSIQHAFDNAAGDGAFSPDGLTSQIKVESGKSLDVKVGRTEQSVVGEIVLSDQLIGADFSTANFRVFLHDRSWKFRNLGAEPVSYPGWTEFSQSSEGAAYRLDGTPGDKPDRILIDKDGRFEIVGLPSARYVLQIRLANGFSAKRFVVPLNASEKTEIGGIRLRVQ